VTDNIRPLTADEVAMYHEDGFVIIPGLFTAEEMQPLTDALAHDPTMGDSRSEVFDPEGKSWKVSAWTELGNSYLGMMPRTTRLVDAVGLLMGEECYHWHSKIVNKMPGDGAVAWHMGFSTWYLDGCPYPRTTTCSIAIDRNDRENGCLQVLKGSHRLGRFDDVVIGNSVGGDLVRVQHAKDTHELVYCELDPGDALFFHAKTLHGSDPNLSDRPRSLMHAAYNARSNEPIFRDRQAHHLYAPLERVADSDFRQMASVDFAAESFMGMGDEKDPGGIFVRGIDS
jgi:ectoine hydroxylase